MTDMKKKKKAVIFDFDGTLCNTSPGILATMRKTFEEMGKTVPTATEMRATIGLPLADALRLLAHLGDEETRLATETYRKWFPHYEPAGTTIYDGVRDTLSALKQRGTRMAVCTSRDRESLILIMRPRGLQEFFETEVTGSDNIKAKPLPDMVLALLRRMRLNAEDVLVVGDTTFDIEMGNAAGCNTCAVTYGNHTPDRLREAKPTYMTGNFRDLLTLV